MHRRGRVMIWWQLSTTNYEHMVLQLSSNLFVASTTSLSAWSRGPAHRPPSAARCSCRLLSPRHAHAPSLVGPLVPSRGAHYHRAGTEQTPSASAECTPQIETTVPRPSRRLHLSRREREAATLIIITSSIPHTASRLQRPGKTTTAEPSIPSPCAPCCQLHSTTRRSSGCVAARPPPPPTQTSCTRQRTRQQPAPPRTPASPRQ